MVLFLSVVSAHVSCARGYRKVTLTGAGAITHGHSRQSISRLYPELPRG
ncbi:hypothetical protein DAD186_17380 [Dermabacter vaginalis]|uniref:Uncharacterized protein n=1 Tax=Dermabacter vaginalis TaxID=1630135 RepID=A0A1B0ZK75_9MICO|nr:hypothetical protein DAD186_17380 [Dermabacter vaginalis]